MLALIDEVIFTHSKDYLVKDLKFSESAILDVDKVLAAGHSFGGITAIRSSMLNPGHIKACITFDPWLYPHLSDVSDGSLRVDQPIAMINSVGFKRICKSFDTDQALTDFGKNCTNSQKQAY